MNVLLTCAGRRVELLRSFRRALQERGSGAVYAADADVTAPALHEADGWFLLPEVTTDDYVYHLLRASREHGITLIVPLIDPELPVLAKKRQFLRQNGLIVMVSGPRCVEMAEDKLLTNQVFREIGVLTPQTEKVTLANIKAITERVGFPLILKPRTGSSSIGVVRCESKDELWFYASRRSDLLAQEFVTGHEVTIDICGDGRGELLGLVPRRRLKTRGGEVERGVTIDDSPFREPVMRIAGCLRPYGVVNLQCFLTDRGPVFIEVNARFGGGYPLSDRAGAGFVEMVLDLAETGEATSHLGEYEQGLLMSRFDSAVYMKYPEADASRLGRWSDPTC